MVEIPNDISLSGIQLKGISNEEKDQFNIIINKVEEYSKDIIKSFNNSTTQIQNKLNEMGNISLKALELLEKSKNELIELTNQEVEQLEKIIEEVEKIVINFECLDGIQEEILRISDILTTVETSIKNN